MNNLLRLITIGLLVFSTASQSFTPARWLYSGLAPTAVNDAYETSEDTPLTVPVSGVPYNGVLFNDSDPEDDPLSAVLVIDVQHGSLTLNANGSFSYSPDENWNGEDTFTYRADDSTSLSNIATVTITVSPVDDVPVAVADSYTTDEDTPLAVDLTLGVIANDIQVDSGETLTAVLDSYLGEGDLTLNPDGSFNYTPALNYNGTDTFMYHLNDGINDSNSVSVTLHVTAVDDPPHAVADQYTTPEDIELIVPALTGILSNDSDAEHQALTAVVNDLPDHGTLTYQPNGSFTYLPDENWYGSDFFTYHAVAGGVSSAVVNVQLDVTPVNDVPIAHDDAYPAVEDVPLTISEPGLLANDTDVESPVLTAYRDTQPAHGSVVVNTNGSFTYTPELNYNGPVTFQYHASDGTEPSNTATVTLTIAAINDAPVAVADLYNTDEDTPLTIPARGVLSNDTDVDTLTLTAYVDSQPANGTLVLGTDGHFTYTPNLNWNGTDTFTYHASDGELNSNTATVTVVVDPVNDIPITQNDSYNAFEDIPLVIAAPGVLGNDNDIEGTTLHAVMGTQPLYGSVALNSDGSFTYTPPANYNGQVSFTYRASDGTDLSPVTTVVITVAAVNDPPVPASDAYTTAEDTQLSVAAPGVIANDQDVDNLPSALTAYVMTAPAHGTLTLNTDGSFVYMPAENYNGPDSFTYYLRDNNDRSTGEATVSLTITAVNDAPVAVNDTYLAVEDTQLSVTSYATGILRNDTDVDGDTLRAVLVAGPAHGSLTLNQNGTFLYNPTTNYNGPDSFTYRANDGQLSSAQPATVSITVQAVNDAPVANAQSPSTAEDTSVNLTLVATDVDGDHLDYSIFSPPSHGVLTGTPPNITYTPQLNYNGQDSFVFQVSDGDLTASATVQLTITPVNDAPVGVGDSYTLAEDNPLTIPVPGLLTNDSDVDNTSLTVSPYIAPTNGTLTLNTNGSFTYTPLLDYNGPDSFYYRVWDGAAFSAVTLVTLTITPVNDAPVAHGESYTINEDVILRVDLPGLLQNDSDVDRDVLFTAVSTSPQHGTVELQSNGSFVYTPAPDYNGTDRFSYTVTDTWITTSPVNVNITILPVNDAPRTGIDEYYIQREGYLPISAPGVLENDMDVEEDPITVKSYTLPSKGTLTMYADGSFTYFTNPGSAGVISFTYTATDGETDASPTTVIIHMEPQSTAVSNWLSPVPNKRIYRVGSEILHLDVDLVIPEGYPCETRDILVCNPDLTYEIGDTYARYYRYDASVTPYVTYEIALVKGPPFDAEFDTSVLKKNTYNEIDVAVTIEIIPKDANGQKVGDSIFLTSEKKYILLQHLPWDNNTRNYFPLSKKNYQPTPTPTPAPVP